MKTDLLESLQILTHLGSTKKAGKAANERKRSATGATTRGNNAKTTYLAIKLIRQELTVLSIDDILLPVHEPVRDLELGRVLDDGDNSLEFIGIEFSGTANDKQ